MIESKISHYKLIEKLGEGGMGTVYKAYDTRLLRHVAIKMLRPDFLIQKSKLLHFIKEAQTASSLNHPNICTIHDIDEKKSQHFIVMELVEGTTLREILDQQGTISEAELINIAIDICNALAVVHEQGICHRDIKPENIMINSRGLIKVMDFGLAKLATEYVESVVQNTGNQNWRDSYTDSVVVTNLSGLLGTIHYMSPEQAQGEEIDARSDIFSLGVMLHELLTGQKPFNGQTNLDILTKIISEPTDLDANTITQSYELCSILLKTLEKEVDKRYQSVTELQRDLQKLKSDSISAAAVPDPPKAPIRTKKSTWALITILAISLFAAGIFIFRPREPDTKLSAMRTSRFTSYVGEEMQPSISPDGNSVAFSWNNPEHKKTDIYVKKMNGGNPVRLTKGQSIDFKPVWSPNGKNIAFLRKYNDSLEVLRLIIMTANGEDEQEIMQLHPTDNGYPGIGWSADNSSIFYPEWSETDLSFVIKRIHLATGNKEQITYPTGTWGDLDPLILYDGKQMLFRRGYPGSFDLCVMDLKTKSVKKITSINTYIYGFCWNEENKSVLFSANLDGSISLWKTDLSGSDPIKVLHEVSIYNPQISPENKQLIYTHRIWGFSIWKLNLDNPEEDEVFISSSFENLDPNISPDGEKILFSSSRTGTHNIWMVEKDGSNPIQLTFFKNRIWGGNAQWSPDGKKVLMNFQRLNFVMNTLDSDPLQLDQMIEFPAWKENGDGYYGQSINKTPFLYSFSADGALDKQITKGPGLAPKIYGAYIYYVRNWEQKEIWRIPLSGGEEEPVVTGISNLHIRSWHVVKNGIYFFHNEDSKSMLSFYDFKSQQKTRIKLIPNVIKQTNVSIDIDPEEQYLLYSRQDSPESDIILVDNFTD